MALGTYSAGPGPCAVRRPLAHAVQYPGQIDAKDNVLHYVVRETSVTISMRELQQNLKQVIERVERGETLELTRRRRVVARLVPAAEARPVAPSPNLDARARAISVTAS